MTQPADRQPETDVPDGAAPPFLLIAFGLAWGIFALFALAPEPVTRVFGPLGATNPLFMLAVYAPAFAALVLVLRHTGLAGLGRYLRRLTLWRCGPGWWALLLLGIPAIYAAGAAAKGALWPLSLPFDSVGAALAAMGFMLILGPVEEIGWRGLLLPLAQRRLAPLWAGLGVGVIWGFWHLPAFLLSGTPQAGWAFLPFLAGAAAVGVILTPLFNASGGSILLAALFHFQLNNPLWPDGQPWDNAIFAAVALAVAWVNRDTMLSCTGAVTAVVPAPRGAAAKA